MRTIIVGNNVAGINTAKSLRDLRPDIEITVFADEKYHYYPRPMLIEFLAGRKDEKSFSFYSEDWYIRNRIKVHLSTPVEEIDVEGKKILADGKWIDFDALVLAPGARAFEPPIKGMPKKNAMTLRTLDDAIHIVEVLDETRTAVIIGGGLLGLEVSHALKQAKPDLKVTVLERGSYLLQRHLDPEGSSILRALIEELDIDVYTDIEAVEIMGGDKVEGVLLNNGERIDAQLVIFSAGIRSNIQLAEASGMKVNRGILIDDFLCCDNDHNIFALGDAAEWNGKVLGIIPAALDQSRIVARRISGQEGPEYSGTVSANTLKLMGIDLTSIGVISPPDGEEYEEIRSKSEDGRAYKKFVLRNGRLIGAILLGSRRNIGQISKFIKEERDLSGLKSNMKHIDFDFAGL